MTLLKSALQPAINEVEVKWRGGENEGTISNQVKKPNSREEEMKNKHSTPGMEFTNLTKFLTRMEISFFFLSDMKFCFMKRLFYTALDDLCLWRDQKAVQQ
jgi:hypothetical protein